MSEKYYVHCTLCPKQFGNSSTFIKHWQINHGQRKTPKNIEFVANDKVAEVPRYKRMNRKGAQYSGYKTWLAHVVERINNTHHPRSKAKWHKIELNYVPIHYFEHLLSDLKKPVVHSINKTHHWRAPIMKLEAMKISYKLYDMEALNDAISESSVEMIKSASWRGHNLEITQDHEDSEMDAELAIQAAKERANKKTAHVSSHSHIVIGEGEGRSTRELEVIWWPDLYAKKNYGKLCLRFYVGKVYL